MSRNEFMNHDDDSFELQVVRDANGIPIDIVKVLKNHPGKGEDEDLSQEVPSLVEEDPHLWPESTRRSLADLRREPGATTTEAHIAEIKAKSDDPKLFD